MGKNLIPAITLTIIVLAGAATAGSQDPNPSAADSTPFTALGTWNGIRTMTTLIQRYESGRKAYFIDFTPADSNQIPGLLFRHKCDVGMTLDSRVPEKAGKTAGRFENVIVGRFVICVIVNAKNPVRAISLDDLGKVFAGKTTAWKDLGGSGKIELYHPFAGSTQAMLFQKKILLGRRYVDQPSAPSTRPRDGKKPDVKAVAGEGGKAAAVVAPQRKTYTDASVIGAVIKQPGAIGFVLCPSDGHLDKRIRILGIAPSEGGRPVFPTPTTVADGSYPLTDSLTLYLHPDAPVSAREFCKFATGPKGARIVNQFGLWPENELNEIRGQQRLAEVKTGNGEAIAVCDLTGSKGILKDLSTEFVKAKAAVELKFVGKAEDAVEKLSKGEIELLLADGGSLNPQIPKSPNPPSSNPPSPQSIELGRMAVGIIVHPENPLASLPLGEVKAIFCGKVKKWPAVRGVAAAMHVFGLKQNSPTTQLLKEKLAMRRALNVSAQPDTGKVILAVARDPAAIGFVDLGQLPPNDKSVKLVPVFEGEGAGGEGLGKGTADPLCRTLTLYVSPKASRTAKEFAEFLTPEHCKGTIAQHNLLPPLEVKETRLASRPDPEEEKATLLALAGGSPPSSPDAPKDQGRTNSGKPAARPRAVSSTSAVQPVTPKLASTIKPVPEKASEAASQPTQEPPQSPSLSDKQLAWLAGGMVGVFVLAAGIGWLGAPKHKKPRHEMSKRLHANSAV